MAAEAKLATVTVRAIARRELIMSITVGVRVVWLVVEVVMSVLARDILNARVSARECLSSARSRSTAIYLSSALGCGVSDKKSSFNFGEVS